MTHHHKIDDREYLLVRLPVFGATDIGLRKFNGEIHLSYMTVALDKVFEKLPPGEWQLVGTSDALGEEQAAQVVRNNGMGCYDNYLGKPDEVYTHLSALDSFNSLLHSLSLTRCAILQRVR